MSRLDQHIAAVQNKLALGLFVRALAWIALGYAALVWLVIIAERSLDRTLPRHGMLLLIGVAAAVVGAFIYGMVHRPTAKMAAVAIDQALGLKEKFSTALYMRPSKDPFAAAAVRDAEFQAGSVSLYKRFPIVVPPRLAGAAVLVALGAFLTALFMPALHLMAKGVQTKTAVTVADGQNPTQKFIAEELPKIEESMQGKNDNAEAIKRATDELNKATRTKEGDENHSRRSALEALQDMRKAITDELQKNEKFQTADQESKQLSQMSDAKDDSTPIGKAQNEIKAGDLDAAMNDISKAVTDFDKMKPEDQQKAVEQAKQLANELSKAANDPKMQQKITSQLMQMGANQTQAQQMAAAMQQAAQGNQAAAQQLQQMAKQMAQQMNNGQGPTQQQSQQMQKMMAQMQGIAGAQAQAGAISQSAQQLAQAMQQAQAAQGQGQQPRPGQGSQGQMQAAQQQMQQQLKDMQAQAKDAQAMKAAADAAANAAQQEANGLNPGQGPGQGNQGQQGQGQSQQGNGQGQGQAQGGNQNGQNQGQGQGQGKGGGKMDIAEAPSDFTQEIDPGKDIDSGKVLASRYVKAGIDPGQSHAGLHDVATAAERDEPDEVDQDHVARDAQQAVKDYFSAMQKEQSQ